MAALQLDLFKTTEECEYDAIRRYVNEIKTSSDKVRRGTYARICKVEKLCYDLVSRLEVLEKNICKGVNQ